LSVQPGKHGSAEDVPHLAASSAGIFQPERIDLRGVPQTGGHGVVNGPGGLRTRKPQQGFEG